MNSTAMGTDWWVGEKLENVCNKNNKAITQEIPPNNTDLPNYADSKIQVGGLSFYNWKYK